MARPTDIAIGVLVEMRDGSTRILITRRPDNTPLAGYWEFPGGKTEPGETAVQCLVREFVEEIGLHIDVGEALPAIEHRYDYGHIRLHPYLCTRQAGEPRNLHVAEHRWVSPDELAAYRFPPANAGLIERLRAMLGGGASGNDG